MSDPTRQVLSIDLGELRARIETRAAAAGLRPGPWIRLQLEHLLQSAGIEAADTAPMDPPRTSRRREADGVKFTARLSPEESAALLARAHAAGLSQSEFIGRLILEQDAGATSHKSELVAAITHSNHLLVGIARDLQAGAHLKSSAAPLTAPDRRHILAVTHAVREHVTWVSRQLAQLQVSRRSLARSRGTNGLEEPVSDTS